MTKRVFVCKNEQDMLTVALELHDLLIRYKVATFEGPPKSGKTTLINLCAELFGVQFVNFSPGTQEHVRRALRIDKKHSLYHYNLSNLDETPRSIRKYLKFLSFPGKRLIFVESPQLVNTHITKDALSVNFEKKDDLISISFSYQSLIKPTKVVTTDTNQDILPEKKFPLGIVFQSDAKKIEFTHHALERASSIPILKLTEPHSYKARKKLTNLLEQSREKILTTEDRTHKFKRHGLKSLETRFYIYEQFKIQFTLLETDTKWLVITITDLGKLYSLTTLRTLVNLEKLGEFK